MRILITGGTGNLGTALVKDLRGTGHKIRIMSRRAAPANAETEWAQVDLRTREGLEASVKDVDVIVHAASSAFRKMHQVDVIGSQKLLEAAKAAGVNHAMYISIVGIDKMQGFSYYRIKREAEIVFEKSGMPYSIARISQFHVLPDVLLQILGKASWLPFLPVPTRWQMQTIDVRDVAKYLHPYILGEPMGRLPDVAGPQVMNFKDMARQWLAAQGKKKPIVRIPAPLGLSEGFKKGLNTVPGNAFGTITWADYLREQYSVPKAESRAFARQ
jgi:uncharacterized protein YbjT (DUF2867 family)